MAFFGLFGKKQKDKSSDVHLDNFFVPTIDDTPLTDVKVLNGVNSEELSDEELEYAAFQAAKAKSAVKIPTTPEILAEPTDQPEPAIAIENTQVELPDYCFPALELLFKDSSAVDNSLPAVHLGNLIRTNDFVNGDRVLPFAVGESMNGTPVIADLCELPHLLIAGSTGQGKSILLHSLITSLLFKKHPLQLKFVMIDPKKVELSIYKKLKTHFLAKIPGQPEYIITDPQTAANALSALCIEMDSRYELFLQSNTREIKGYNAKFVSRNLNPGMGHRLLPYLIVVIDEFADLITNSGKNIEYPITQLAQKGRPAGIHLVISTQHPSGRVLPNAIKTNFLSRVAFKVPDKAQSITIIDKAGAELLTSKGEMLFTNGGPSRKLQGAYVSMDLTERVVEFIGNQQSDPYAFWLPELESEESKDSYKVDLTNRDKLFGDCAQTVVSTQSGSTSNLQRKFNLGYNRAGRIMDQLEAAGIVGPAVGSMPREVYFKTEYELEQFLDTLG